VHVTSLKIYEFY